MPIGGLGMMEIIMIFLVILLLFGAKRLPEIGSSLGKGIREFKGSIREIEGELKAPLEDPKPVPPGNDESREDGPRRLTTSEEENPD
jgi:sec-independent protein translocase protein TatA